MPQILEDEDQDLHSLSFDSFGDKKFNIKVFKYTDYQEETKEFVFNNGAKVEVKRLAFFTSTAGDAQPNYSIVKSYFDRHGRLHNDKGPAVVMWQEDLRLKNCLWYINGKMVTMMTNISHEDYMNDKERCRNILSLVMLKECDL